MDKDETPDVIKDLFGILNQKKETDEEKFRKKMRELAKRFPSSNNPDKQ